MSDKINIVGSTLQGTVAVGHSAKVFNTGPQTVSTVSDNSALNELLQTLANQGVRQSELDALNDAIDRDASTSEVAAKKLGPAVKAWMTMMFSKAADASWQIELGVAGSLLASAIQRYYGWP